MTEPKWPEKKESSKGNDCTCGAYYYGECGCGAAWADNDEWNACHDAFMKVIEAQKTSKMEEDLSAHGVHIQKDGERIDPKDFYVDSHPKIHSCKCQRHPDSAFTARQLDEGLLQCPRCGGIIVIQSKEKLVELDENKLRESLLPLFMRMGDRKSTVNDLNVLIQTICSKFGTTPRAEIMSVELTREKWMEIMMPFHGGNPHIWAIDMDKIYDEYFDIKTHKPFTNS